jgi:uncharacterized repeat protein (TIGR01451 family)
LKISAFILLLALILVLTVCGTATGADLNQTYTNDTDFDEGTLVGLEHNSTSDQLQLSESSQSAFSYIWVPNSNEGTVSKVDTLTGLELARYRTSTLSYSSPSRTTVDLDGNCWVGNRQTGTVVKIGLFENGGYIDRDLDGVIDTCHDLDGNGVITADELLPWGEDECVIYEVVLIPGLECTYAPGDYNGPYANDSGNPGPRGIAVDSQNNVWIGCYGTGKYYYVSGSNGHILKVVDVSMTGHTPYGAVIDQNGILWSSGAYGNSVLRLDPSDNSSITINLGHFSYGIGLDRNNHLFVTGWNYACLSRINTLTGEIEWTKPSPVYSRGVAVNDDGDVWIANSTAGTVTRYSNDGDYKATIIVGNTPTGVSIDNNGKVWVVDNDDEYIHRISPTRNETDSAGNIVNGVELSKRIIGTAHYGYSDMTGVISSTITTMKGSWTFIHDSGLENTPWGIISWDGHEPVNTSITVRVRSSSDQQNWSSWEEAINGVTLSSIPAGRYLQVETTLQRLQGNQTPILYDLTVTALVADIQLNMTVDKTSPPVGEEVTFTVKATNHGPLYSSGLNININLPPGFSIRALNQGICQNGIWNIENLIKGDTATLTITGVVNHDMAHQLITCTAEKIQEDQYDPTTPDTARASFYLPLSDLEATTTVNSSTLNVGDTAVFTTTIQNNGPDPSHGLTVEKPLPPGFISLPPSLGTYQNGMWTMPLLEAGTTATLTFLREVTPEMVHSTITDASRIIIQEFDPTPVSLVTSSFYVPLADVEIIKTAYQDPVTVGGVALFNITVENNGPDSASNVVVKDPLPTGFIPGNPSQGLLQDGWWLVGNLLPGESATLLMGRLVEDVETITSYGQVMIREYDPNRTNNQPLLSIRAQEQIKIIKSPLTCINPQIPWYPDGNTIPMQNTGIPLNLSSLAILLVFLGTSAKKTGLPRKKPLLIFLILIVALLACGVVSGADGSANYTSDPDFDTGTLVGVENEPVTNQIQLTPAPEEIEFIWVPNTNEGTISKINTRTGAEVASYRTSSRTDAFPSTVAVDGEGNCWVANVCLGSVVKIGLLENNQYQDRDHDGVIQTSRDLDHNGVITPDEILSWGSDECVLYETILVPGLEGTYVPGEYQGSYGNYSWYFGLRSLVLDKDGNCWAGNYETRQYHYINGADGQVLRILDASQIGHNSYNGVMDKNGILWFAGNNLLRLDPFTGSMSVIEVGHFSYGMAYDGDDHIFLSGYYYLLSRINIQTCAREWTKPGGGGSRGVAVSSDGDVWTADDPANVVTRYSHDGQLKATIIPGNNPIGLSVDSEGKIWVIDNGDEYIHRIDPAISGVDLSKRIVGGYHYGHSQMTTPTSKTNYLREGTWRVTHDSGQDNNLWGIVNWTSSEPPGTSIKVRVRSSNDQMNWSKWEDVIDGVKLHLTPAGRYLQVEATLQSTLKNVSPILYDLTITPLSDNPQEPVKQTDLTVSILTDNYKPSINDDIKITLNAGNNGADDATGVNVSYNIPSGLEFQSSDGNYDPSGGLWAVGSLNKGTVATIEILAKTLNAGSLINTGTITGTEYEPNVTNNQATLTLNIPNPTNTDIMPEMPAGLPVNGAAGLPPISGIEDALNGDNSGTSPSSSNQDPSALNTLNSQLAMDIAYVREAVSQGSLDQSAMTVWTLTADGSSGSNNDELEAWKSFLVKFAGDAIFFAAFSLIPDEYLQEVRNAFLNSFETMASIAKYFGYGKQVKEIAGLWERTKGVLGSPFFEGFISKWDDLMSVLDFNVGMKLLEWALIKIFPNAATEIKLLIATISTANLTDNNGETIKTIINIGSAILAKNIPNPEDLLKLL